jgi:hypothetical protein
MLSNSSCSRCRCANEYGLCNQTISGTVFGIHPYQSMFFPLYGYICTEREDLASLAGHAPENDDNTPGALLPSSDPFRVFVL